MNFMFNLVEFPGWKKVMVKLLSLMLQTQPENVENICINELCLKKAITLFPALKGGQGVRRFGDSGRSMRSVEVIELESP